MGVAGRAGEEASLALEEAGEPVQISLIDVFAHEHMFAQEGDGPAA
jgi:hypothetical protein